ncbi:MAG: hypothetical protein EAX87_00880 [Candidatus Thorarchaeota archaeon]|nr:hypothetical protein [Candidatus Thorarchaeota archaeon]
MFLEEFKMGLFGTTAPVFIDVNLILQYVTLVILIIGYFKTKPRKTHGYLMVLVLFITAITTILIMAPRLLVAIAGGDIFAVLHASIGSLAIILGAVFASRFIIATTNKQPLVCGTKRMMRIAFVLWVLPILSGSAIYILLYL